MNRFLPFEYRASFKQLLLKFSLEVIVVVLMGIFSILVLGSIFPQFFSLLTSSILLFFVFLIAVFLFSRNNFRHIGVSREHLAFTRILGKTLKVPIEQVTSITRRGNNNVRIEYSNQHLILPLNSLPEKKKRILEFLFFRLIPRTAFPALVQTQMSLVDIFKANIKTGQLSIEDASITTNKRKLIIKRTALTACTVPITGFILFAAKTIGSDSYAGATIIGGLILFGFVFLWRSWTTKSISIDENHLTLTIGKNIFIFGWSDIELITIPYQPYIQIWTIGSSKKISYRNFSVPDVEKMLDSLQKRAHLHDIPIG